MQRTSRKRRSLFGKKKNSALMEYLMMQVDSFRTTWQCFNSKDLLNCISMQSISSLVKPFSTLTDTGTILHSLTQNNLCCCGHLWVKIINLFLTLKHFSPLKKKKKKKVNNSVHRASDTQANIQLCRITSGRAEFIKIALPQKETLSIKHIESHNS